MSQGRFPCPRHSNSDRQGNIFPPLVPLPADVLGCSCNLHEIPWQKWKQIVTDPTGPLSPWWQTDQLVFRLKWDCTLAVHEELWPAWQWLTWLLRIEEHTDELPFMIILDMFDFKPTGKSCYTAYPVRITEVEGMLSAPPLRNRIMLRVAELSGISDSTARHALESYKQECRQHVAYIMMVKPSHCVSPKIMIPPATILIDTIDYRCNGLHQNPCGHQGNE